MTRSVRAALAAALLLSSTAAAQEAPSQDELRRRLDALEKKVQEQQRTIEELRERRSGGEPPAAGEEAGPPPPNETSVTPPEPAGDEAGPARKTAEERKQEDELAERLRLEANLAGFLLDAAPGRGVTVTAPDEEFALTLRARIQLRDTLLLQDDDELNEINVRTARLFVQGYVLDPDVKYLVQLAFGSNDFEASNSSPIFDAFVECTEVRDASLRVGQYFVPFDRARTIREFALQFVDRQIVVRELTLDRDVGVMLSSSDLLGLKMVSYNLFVGGGDGRNRFGAQELGVLTVARLGFRPFGPFDDDSEGDLKRKPEPRLAIGVAGGYNYRTNRAQSTFGSTYTAGRFDYVHAAADLVFKWHGFSLLMEGVLRRAEQDSVTRLVNGVATRQFSRSGYGYFVQGGYMLTDELEAVARWDHLIAEDRDTDPALITLARQQGRQVGGGFNLYLNGHAFKVQLDYFYVFGHNDEEQKDHQVRLQLDVSF